MPRYIPGDTSNMLAGSYVGLYTMFLQPSLQSIELHFDEVNPRLDQDTNDASSAEFFRQLLQSCPSLTSFRLWPLPEPRPNLVPHLRSFFLNCSPLKLIQLPGELDLGSDVVQAIFRMPKLEEFEINCDEGGAFLPGVGTSQELKDLTGVRKLKLECSVGLQPHTENCLTQSSL
jgi:hypothetical protein